MSRQWRSAFFLVRNTLAKNICPTYHAGQIHSADLKEERCVAAIKTRGRQYNTNILYFTANCGWRGNNRGSQEGLMLKRSPHTGRKQNMIIGASFYHSGQLDIWKSGQIKRSNSFAVFVSVWAGSWNISSAVAVQHVSQISFAQTALSLDVLAIGHELPFACIVQHGCALVVAWIVYVVHITMVVVVQVVIWRKKMHQGPKKFFLQPVTSSSTTWMVLALLILTVSFAWVGKEKVENKCFTQHLSDKGEKWGDVQLPWRVWTQCLPPLSLGYNPDCKKWIVNKCYMSIYDKRYFYNT